MESSKAAPSDISHSFVGALDTKIIKEFKVKEIIGALILKHNNTKETRKCTIEINARFRCT